MSPLLNWSLYVFLFCLIFAVVNVIKKKKRKKNRNVLKIKSHQNQTDQFHKLKKGGSQNSGMGGHSVDRHERLRFEGTY